MSFINYFEKNYIQKFEISKREKQLMSLSKEYHDACDSYDDRICSGKNEYGESTPRTNTEFQLVNQNAAYVRNMVIKKGLRLGFSKNEISKAISKYQ
jgi:hypothetical protein